MNNYSLAFQLQILEKHFTYNNEEGLLSLMQPFEGRIIRLIHEHIDDDFKNTKDFEVIREILRSFCNQLPFLVSCLNDFEKLISFYKEVKKEDQSDDMKHILVLFGHLRYLVEQLEKLNNKDFDLKFISFFRANFFKNLLNLLRHLESLGIIYRNVSDSNFLISLWLSNLKDLTIKINNYLPTDPKKIELLQESMNSLEVILDSILSRKYLDFTYKIVYETKRLINYIRVEKKYQLNFEEIETIKTAFNTICQDLENRLNNDIY